MNNITYDRHGFNINGEDAFMVSGEFHYFRVPKSDWKRRMELFVEAGGNTLATYVPWLIHEPEEGKILFSDVDGRDLVGFLKTAKEVGLNVMLRPGPYQYSELVYGGLPTWLIENYPEILAKNVYGNVFNESGVSYLHPLFLEKARKYYRVFADQVRPYLSENGGCVSMIQVDNEVMGAHIWSGSLDYNPTSMGFGSEDGRYAKWLKNKYNNIENLNNHYNTSYKSFAEVRPAESVNQNNIYDCRRHRDYEAFYRAGIGEYLATLKQWLREYGLTSPVCHNSGNYNMNSLFPEVLEKTGGDILLGSDHYYALSQDWDQNNPTPLYAIHMLLSCDTLKALGMPPSAMELPGGSPSDTPPILREDLLACQMTNIAMGIKGINNYIFTGGPNFPGTGGSCDVYDFNAPIHADGTLNETYYALKDAGMFMKNHSWLQRCERQSSVQLGYEWNMLRDADSEDKNLDFKNSDAKRFIVRGLLYTLLCGCYAPEMVLLTNKLDIKKPLIVPCTSSMSKEAQQAIADFINMGGNAILIGLPETDTDSSPCAVLRDAIGNPVIKNKQRYGFRINVRDLGNVYGIGEGAVCEKLPEGAEITATDEKNEKIIGYKQKIGKGNIIWFGATWTMTTFPQAEMLEIFLKKLGAEPCVEHSNRNVFTSYWKSSDGKKLVFLMNLYSGAQSTFIKIEGDTEIKEEIKLKPMEVKTIEI